MKMKRLLWAFMMIAALALLAGCGGGGGTSLMIGGDRATQDAINDLIQNLEDAEGERDTAQGERDAANATLTTLMGALGAASTSAADLTAAVTALEGMRDGYQGRVNAATMAIDTALGMDATGDLAADIATLHGMLTSTEGDRQTAQDALDALQMALGADSTSEADLTAAVTELEGMRNAYRMIVNAVRTELGVAADADQATILAEIMRLAESANPFAVAQAQRDIAAAASASSVAAVTEATEKSELLGADDTRGVSATAMANAQAVLDARTTVTEDVNEAAGALDRLKSTREGVDETDDLSADLIKALDAAIVVAEAAVTTTEEQRDSRELRRALEEVEGDDADDPMTAADHASRVAMAVGGALMPTTSTDGSGVRVNFVTAVTAADPTATPPVLRGPTGRPAGEAMYEQRDAREDTWEDIVGSNKVMGGFRLASAADDTDPVRAASFAGMPVYSLDAITLAADGTVSGTLPTVADGTELPGTYMGIPGTIFCQGVCSFESTEADDVENTLTGNWYFTPTNPDAWYVQAADDAAGNDMYVAETQFARWGYWVTEDADGEATINVYAITGEAATGTTSGTNFSVAAATGDNVTPADNRAEYSGSATGLSLYKEFNPDGTVVDGYPQTGVFNADVDLTARFGDAPTLSGEVTNFRGDAVDSSWKVDFLSAAFADGTVAETDNATAASNAQDGIWTATAYGGDDATARPNGIFGHFNAHFTNGHAAGAYATTKD